MGKFDYEEWKKNKGVNNYEWDYEGWKNNNKVDLVPPPLSLNPRKQLNTSSMTEGMDLTPMPSTINSRKMLNNKPMTENVDLTDSPLTLNPRKQLNTSSITKGIDLTPIDLAPDNIPQPQKEGFWEKVRNANLEETLPFKTIKAIGDIPYKIPLTQRFFTTLGNTIGGEGNVKADDGSAMQKMDAGKVGNLVSDIAGTGVAYGMKLPGMNNSVQGSINNVLNPLESKLLSKLPLSTMSKAGQRAAEYGVNALKSGIDMSAGNVIQGVAQGQDIKDIGESGLNGLWQGAAFGTAVKGAGDLGKSALSKIISKVELPKVEETEIKPSNSLDKPLPEPSKLQDNINTPNTNKKPLENLKEPLNTKDLEFTTQGIKYAKQYEKITDADYLKKHIAELETAMTTADEPTKLEMNLQLFAAKEQLKKLSRFYSNSLQNTQILPDEVKNMLNEADFMYGVKTNQGELSKAQQRITSRGIQAEMDRLKKSTSYDNAEDAMAHLLITRDLVKEAEQKGDYSKVVNWLKDTRKKTTNTAQALQAVSAWKKTTPEGALIKATNVVDQVQEDLRKNNPKLMDKVDKEAKGVKDALDNAKKEAAKEVEEKLPETMLSNKISSTLSDPKDTKPNLVQDMVNELFRVAKESPLPENAARAKRSPLDFLQEAIQNKGQYADVWEKAKGLVRDKYKNDPEALNILDDYFNKGIIPQYSNATVKSSIKVTIKDLGQTIENIARSSRGDKEAFLSDLTDYIQKTTGASGSDASILANKIKEQYDLLVKEKADSIIKQMFKERTAPHQKNILEKVMELDNLGALTESQYKDLILEKYGIPTLTPEDAKFITETMTKVQDMAEGYDKNAEIAKVMQLIADKIPATATEKLQAYLRMSMLANVKTLLTRNPLGNVGLGIAENIKDIPASLIDRAISLKTGKRTTIAPSLSGLKEQGKGMIQGVTEWGKDLKQGIDTSPSKGQYELPSKRIFHNKVLNAVDQFTRRALGLGDRPFYQAAYNERLRQLQVINKSKDITEDMIEDATNYALDRTLQNDSSMAKGAAFIKKGLNLNKEFGLGSMAMPFTTTPANVLDKALDYSPLGTLKAAKEWIKFSKTGALDQKKLVDELGRSITGTSAIVLGWELAKNGLATGKASTNERERELNRATGVNDYSFKIGNKYKTFDWAAPMSLPLAMGIDMYNAKKTKGDIKSALTSAGDTVFKQSFLQGISRMFGGNSPSTGVLNTVTNSYSMAIPSTLKQVTQLADPYQRETYSDNPKEQFMNNVKAKVPFLSKTLPAKVDVLGNDIKQFDGRNNPFNVLINPGYSNTDTNTKGTNMVRSIVESTGNKDILPKITKPEITYVKEVKNAGTKNREEVKDTIKLTSKELTEFKKYIGQETQKLYEDKANNDSFMQKSAKDKAKELESLLRKIYDKGEEKILKSRNIRFY